MSITIQYLASRMCYLASLSAGVVLLAFLLFHLAPTDPARVALGPYASQEQVAAFQKRHGLDRTVPQQFIDYVVDLSSLDFGESWVDQRLVTAEVSQRLAVTSGVATMALALIVLWIVFAFVLASSRHGRRLLGVAQFAFVALPTLFMGVLVALVAVEVYPYSRFQGTWDLSDLLFFLPPAAVLALYPAGAIGQLVCQQTSILEQSDMVRAARARGVTVNQVRWRYVARTAAIPIIAALFNQVPLLITSSFVVEIIFSVPGIGAGLLNAVMQRDLPMVEGIVIFTSLVTLVTSRLGDLLYPLIDPRIVRSVN